MPEVRLARAKSQSEEGGATALGPDLLSEPPLASAPAMPAPDMPADFEAALADLEALVQRLEAGELSLDEGLHAYRRGVELVRLCQERLARAEKQVRVLDADLLRPLEGDDLRGDA